MLNETYVKIVRSADAAVWKHIIHHWFVSAIVFKRFLFGEINAAAVLVERLNRRKRVKQAVIRKTTRKTCVIYTTFPNTTNYGNYQSLRYRFPLQMQSNIKDLNELYAKMFQQNIVVDRSPKTLFLNNSSSWKQIDHERSCLAYELHGIMVVSKDYPRSFNKTRTKALWYCNVEIFDRDYLSIAS